MHSSSAKKISFEAFEEEDLNTSNASENNLSTGNVVSNILEIMKTQQNNLPLELDTSEKFLRAKEKLIKQLPNMYKNTRLSKFLIQTSPVATKIEYKKIKGLVLNIEKRMSWYLNVEQEKVKCLLISTRAKTAKEDLAFDDPKKSFFEYYAKAIVTEAEKRKFIPVPLVDLNIIVI